MIELKEYSWLSELVYNGSRMPSNRLDLQKALGNDWQEIEYITDDKGKNPLATDFSAGVYKKGNNEIVIAFTGTNTPMAEHWDTNIPAAMGYPTDQVRQALDLVIKTLQEHPDAHITFTGHSLGGGLAAMMATFFNKEAVVFDEAPFQNSATDPVAVFYYASYLKNTYGLDNLPQAFIDYCNSSGIGDAWQTLDITAEQAFEIQNYKYGQMNSHNYEKETEVLEPNPPLSAEAKAIYTLLLAQHFSEFSSREQQITNYYVKGEVLELIRTDDPNNLGVPGIYNEATEQVIDLGNSLASAYVGKTDGLLIANMMKDDPTLNLVNLHLIPILQAALWSDKFKAALQKHNYAVGIFYDRKLYGFDYNTEDDANFVVKAVKEHVENKNGWLDLIANDMNKIIDNKETTLDDVMVRGLLSALSEYWYFNESASKDSAFTQLTGGLQVDFTKFSLGSDGKGKNAFIDNLKMNLQMYTSPEYTIGDVFDAVVTNTNFSKFNVFTIGNYNQALNTGQPRTDEGTFIFGLNASSVNATGGKGNDYIIGSLAGSDSFNGGEGNDTLISLYGKSTINGGENDDVIFSLGGNAKINGDEGKDIIVSIGDNSQIDGGADNDVIYIYGDNTAIKGGGGNDIIMSYGKGNILEGGDGDDRYFASSGDIIRDSDGVGKVFLNGMGLVLGFQDKDNKNSFYDLSSGNVFELQGTTLVVNGTFRIENFLDKGVTLESLQELNKPYSKLGITLWFYKEQDKQPPTIDDKVDRQQIVGEDDPDKDHADSLYGEDAGVNYHIQGKLGDDYLEGNAGKDSLEGGEGDDTLVGKAGDDILDGGEGDDYLKGDAGNDILMGGEGDDYLKGDADNDILIGGEGSNRLYGGVGDDWLFATKQEEVDANWGSQGSSGSKQMGSVLSGGDGEDTLVGSDFIDVIFGGKGNKLIYAGKGDDVILLNQTSTSAQLGWAVYLDTNGYQYWVKRDEYGKELISRDWLDVDTEVINTVYAGAGNDYVEGSTAGQDIIYAGIGNDTIYNGRGNGLVFGEDGDDFIFGDSYKYIFNEVGNSYDYRWISEDKKGVGYGNDTLDGGDGKDTIIGAGGDDVIYGGKGDDSLFGDHRSETLTAEHYGDDYLDGGAGNDIIYAGGGHDTILGGAGNDTILADDDDADITIQGNDYVDGGEGDDSIYGEAGNDTLLGGIGNDSLCGGLGDDSISGGEGDDYMLGDDNNDKTKHGNDYMEGGIGKDSIWGMGGDDTLLGGDDDDYLDGDEGDNYLYGGTGNDTLNAVGNADESKHGNNYLDGGEGNDILISGFGSDTLIGGAGADQLVQFNPSTDTEKDNDYLDGGDGNDTLSALTGNNTLLGGKGNDVLVSDLAAFEGFKDIGVIANDYLDGGEGNDFLISAGGADTLIGGTGSDTYSIFLKEGNTVILSEEGTDIDYVTLAGSNISYEDPNTKISIGASGMIIETPKGKVILANYNQFEYITFTEGTKAVADIISEVNAIYNNHAPIAQGKLDNQQTEAGNSWQWNLPQDSFIDIDQNDTLTYKATLEDGSPLPDWLSYDPATGQLTGTIPDTTGQYNILITAYDKVGASASHSFTLEVIPENTDKMKGTEGNDLLTGDEKDNYLMGLGGNDTLLGNAGNDTLIGGAGNDYLAGGDGSDVYSFARGWGQDTIYDYGYDNQLNKIIFTDNINPQDIILERKESQLKIYLKDSDDTITMLYYFSNNDVKEIIFADGTVWDYEYIIHNMIPAQGTIGNDDMHGTVSNDLLNGYEGNDTIRGYEGNDTLIGGIGNDYLKGEGGDDIYYFERGWGNDTIDEEQYSNGLNKIQFGKDISPEDIKINIDDDNSLIIFDQSTGDSIKINNFYSGYPIKEIIFADGTIWGLDKIVNIPLYTNNTLIGTDANDSLMGSYDGYNLIQGGMGNDSLTGGIKSDILQGGEGNDTIYGNNGNDLIEGGAGDDSLMGGTGNDTYYFEQDWGNDTINAAESINSNYQDKIIFGKGINPEDIIIYRTHFETTDKSNLVIIDKNTGSQIVVYKFFITTSVYFTYHINSIEFADGTVWSYEDILKQCYKGTDSNDLLTGHETDDLIKGSLGNDTLYGYKGNDTLMGDAGDDLLLGDSGSDLLIGGTGNDLLIGGTGSDTYYFEQDWGNDTVDCFTINGGSTTDSIRFAEGIALTDLIFYKSGDDLIIYSKDKQNSILINKYYIDPIYQVSDIAFADGTILTYQQINQKKVIIATDSNETLTGTTNNDVIYGFAGNDVINANAGNDILNGGLGNDTLNGGAGSDTYLFAKGDGIDTINTGDTNQAIDTIRFTDIKAEQITGISRIGNNLIISYGNNDKITITNHFTTTPIGYIAFGDEMAVNFQDFLNNLYGGLTLGTGADNFTFNNQDHLIKAGLGNDRITTGTGNDTLYGEAGNDNLTGGTGDDLLIGGIGNDTLNGGVGSDTYLFSKGDGIDTINTGDTNQAIDTIRFTDIKAEQITGISRIGNNLIISYGNNDKITITNHFTTAPIGYIAFGDETAVNFQDFLNNLYGGLTLGTGADNFTFNNQDHLIKAGLGNDRITTGAGNDTLYGEAGNDTLTAGAGDDLLVGGQGNDSLTGGTGSDTYLFGRGEGQDTLNNTTTTWQNDNDRLLFQQGINADQLWFQKSANNLIVSVIGTTDKVTISNWYLGDQYKLDSFELANGENLLASQVDNLVNAMASFKPPVSGQTELPDDYHNKLDTVIAAGWN